jgi:hypothetical protein
MMASWQIKGLLLLASALVAITLVASTTGAVANASADAAAAIERPAGAEVLTVQRSGAWYDR